MRDDFSSLLLISPANETAFQRANKDRFGTIDAVGKKNIPLINPSIRVFV